MTCNPMTLILSNDDVEALLPMSDCIAALEEAYRELAHERAASAVRTRRGQHDCAVRRRVLAEAHGRRHTESRRRLQ